MGISKDTLQVLKVVNGRHCVKFHIRSNLDGFECALIPIYGAAQEEHKPEFLAKLVRVYEIETLPMLIEGDFNIMRRHEDKNKPNFNAHWCFVFNAIIESLDLWEIELSGRQYTWANRREYPTYEKLDRVLTSVEWEHKFPLVLVQALPRAGSDQTPLILDSGEQAHLGNEAHFSFELSWLRRDDFAGIIAREWNSIHHGNNCRCLIDDTSEEGSS